MNLYTEDKIVRWRRQDNVNPVHRGLMACGEGKIVPESMLFSRGQLEFL